MMMVFTVVLIVFGGFLACNVHDHIDEAEATILKAIQRDSDPNNL